MREPGPDRCYRRAGLNSRGPSERHLHTTLHRTPPEGSKLGHLATRSLPTPVTLVAPEFSRSSRLSEGGAVWAGLIDMGRARGGGGGGGRGAMQSCSHHQTGNPSEGRDPELLSWCLLGFCWAKAGMSVHSIVSAQQIPEGGRKGGDSCIPRSGWSWGNFTGSGQHQVLCREAE